METLNRSVYSREENKVFNLLTITGRYKIVGSQSIPHIKYKSDFDLLEYFNTLDVGKYPQQILKIFQKKFERASKDPNIFITDFKCGEDDKGEPLRWTKQTIKKGSQVVGGKEYKFVDVLLQKSIIKMDIIAFIDGIATEFTEMYYFTLNGYQNYDNKPIEKIYEEILEDGREYLKQGNVMKALKRVYASLNLLDKEKPIRKMLVEFFNGHTGWLNSVKNDIDTLKTLTENKFRKPPRDKVKDNISLIQQKLTNCPDKRLKEVAINELEEIKNKVSLKQMPKRLDEIREYIQQKVNKESHEFVEKHPKLKSFF
jgi:hypothetical protein